MRLMRHFGTNSLVYAERPIGTRREEAAASTLRPLSTAAPLRHEKEWTQRKFREWPPSRYLLVLCLKSGRARNPPPRLNLCAECFLLRKRTRLPSLRL